MKKLLLAGLLLSDGTAAAQIPGKSVPDFTTKMGTTFHKGDTLRMVMGKADNGSFRYAYIPRNAWIGTPQVQLNSTWNNLRPVIKDIRAQETAKNMGIRTVAVVSTGGINACVDLQSAEEAGEIQTAHNQQRPAASQQVSSPADELLKLKKLLDAGALTPAEFEEQKAKLLKKL